MEWLRTNVVTEVLCVIAGGFVLAVASTMLFADPGNPGFGGFLAALGLFPVLVGSISAGIKLAGRPVSAGAPARRA